jgi:hypothetical protein
MYRYLVIQTNGRNIYKILCSFEGVKSFFIFLGLRGLVIIVINLLAMKLKLKIEKDNKNRLLDFYGEHKSYYNKKLISIIEINGKRYIRKIVCKEPFKNLMKKDEKGSKYFSITDFEILKKRYFYRDNFYISYAKFSFLGFNYKISNIKDIISILNRLYKNNLFEKLQFDKWKESLKHHSNSDLLNIINLKEIEMTMIHGDFTSWNIKKHLITKKITILDFEYFRKANYLYDLFYYFTIKSLWNKDKRKIMKFLQQLESMDLYINNIKIKDINEYYKIFLIEWMDFVDDDLSNSLDNLQIRPFVYDIFKEL